MVQAGIGSNWTRCRGAALPTLIPLRLWVDVFTSNRVVPRFFVPGCQISRGFFITMVKEF